MAVAHKKIRLEPICVDPYVDPDVLDQMLAVTRFYLPYLRVIRATSGMRGRPYLVSALRGIVIYDGHAPLPERRVYLSTAIHELWAQRHLAGLSEYQHVYHRHLSAVS